MRLPPIKLLLVFVFLAAFVDGIGQACSDTVFKFRYFSNDSIYASNHINTSDGSLIVAESRNYPFKKGLVIKVNAAGELLWSTQLEGIPNLNLYKALALKDGSCVVAGTAVQKNPVSNNAFVAKLDHSGNLLWQRFYKLNNNSNLNPVHVYCVSEGIDGELLVCWQRTHINFGVNDDKASSLLMRLNRDGTVAWSSYLSVGDRYFSNIAGIYLSGNKVFAFGQVYDTTLKCPVNGQGGAFALMEIDYVSGTINLQKNYCFTEFETALFVLQSADHHYSTTQLNDGKLAIFGTFFQRNDKNYHYKFIFDEQLNIDVPRIYTTPYREESLSMIQVLPSGITAITTLYDNQTALYGFVDKDEKRLDQRATSFSTDIVPMDYVYNFSFNYFNWTYGEKGLNKVTLVNNLRQGNLTYIELTQMNKRSNTLSCLGTDTNFISSSPLNTSTTNWSWKTIERDRIISEPATFSAANHPVKKQVICIQMETCTALTIAGADTVCTNGQPVDYVSKKGACSKEVKWNYDPAWVTSANQINDTTLRILFKKPVSFPIRIKLYASLSDCIIMDSLEITLLPSATPLPPDTIICGAVDMLLNPGADMKTYLWQDGSSAAVYRARNKGVFSVMMEDYCGNRLSDTIRISEPLIDLGSDTTICAGDSLNLVANTGFTNYKWTATNYVQLSGNMIRVSPGLSTTYVVGGISNGCAASDTIQVMVHPPITSFIINDTTICSYADLTLRPSSNFRAYLWSNGTTASSLFIDKPGYYWLQVTNQEGCKAKQTITVRSKPCSTYVYFPSAFSPNQDGKNDLFRPLIAGRLTSYHFQVYNRWGQKVFSSNDANKGWDGMIRGLPQPTGIFVWSCEYQLVGEQKELKKGTVMLAR